MPSFPTQILAEFEDLTETSAGILVAGLLNPLAVARSFSADSKSLTLERFASLGDQYLICKVTGHATDVDQPVYALGVRVADFATRQMHSSAIIYDSLNSLVEAWPIFREFVPSLIQVGAELQTELVTLAS